MRADSHAGPEPKRSTSEVLYIDAALTFVDLGIPPCYARPGHTLWHDSEEVTAKRDVCLAALSGLPSCAMCGRLPAGNLATHNRDELSWHPLDMLDGRCSVYARNGKSYVGMQA